MEPLTFDTETTGLRPGPQGAEALSVAIIDYHGNELLNSLVRPVRHTSWPDAQEKHGITPEMVFAPGVPTLAELTPRIAEIFRGQVIMAYNAPFDCAVLEEAIALGPPAQVLCSCQQFAEHYGDWSDHFQSFKFQSLVTAARHVGHVWRGANHGALPDCFAARDVWAWLNDPAERERLDAATQRREERAEVKRFLARLAEREREADERAARSFTNEWLYHIAPLLGISWACPLEFRASKSADVFCRHLTGYSVEMWNGYGQKLKLPRYGKGPGVRAAKLPKHLTQGCGLHFLRPTWAPEGIFGGQPDNMLEPVAMWQDRADPDRLYPVYSLRKLVLGVDYVPRCLDYQPGYCSRTALVRDHNMKPKEADKVLPAYLLVRTKYEDYLLYPIPNPAPEGHPAP